MDVIVTTAGGIEEDFIKCLAHTYLGDFSLPGKELRLRGINRLATADTIHVMSCLLFVLKTKVLISEL